MEEDLFQNTFGSNWRDTIVKLLNEYDDSQNWPAYKRSDGLGLFARALLLQEVPIIGVGETARKMELTPRTQLPNPGTLSYTRGLAGLFNMLLGQAGVMPQSWEKKDQLGTTFAQFDREQKQQLLLVASFESLVDFYIELSVQWAAWFGIDSPQHKKMPDTIWSIYGAMTLSMKLDMLKKELEGNASLYLDVLLDVSEFISQKIDCPDCETPLIEVSQKVFGCPACHEHFKVRHKKKQLPPPEDVQR